jgi:hypothetical protein
MSIVIRNTKKLYRQLSAAPLGDQRKGGRGKSYAHWNGTTTFRIALIFRSSFGNEQEYHPVDDIIIVEGSYVWDICLRFSKLLVYAREIHEIILDSRGWV